MKEKYGRLTVIAETSQRRWGAPGIWTLHYDHPILIWHKGYHHGQIKLALKLAGRPISDEEAGPVTCGVWMRKK